MISLLLLIVAVAIVIAIVRRIAEGNTAKWLEVVALVALLFVLLGGWGGYWTFPSHHGFHLGRSATVWRCAPHQEALGHVLLWNLDVVELEHLPLEELPVVVRHLPVRAEEALAAALLFFDAAVYVDPEPAEAPEKGRGSVHPYGHAVGADVM